MKTYIIIYQLETDNWNLYELNPETHNPRGYPIVSNDESVYELLEEAREYGIPREAVMGKAQDNMVTFE